MMVYRIYVEKKTGLANEAASLRSDIKTLLGIDRIEDVRVINRYDVENIDEALFADCRWKVFAEPQLDNTFDSLEELTALFVDGNALLLHALVHGARHGDHGRRLAGS